MRQACKLQAELGWNLTFCGLFDDNWGAHQEQYFDNKPERREDEKGIVWSTKICTWMIREARQLWLTRNAEVYDSEEGSAKKEADIIQQVRKLYQLGGDMSHLDRQIFEEPLDNKLKRPIHTLQQWVKNTIPVANRCIRDFQQRLRTGQHDIRSYFSRKELHNNAASKKSTTTPIENRTVQKSESTIPE